MLYGNPIPGMLVADLSDEQRADIRQVLDGMLRERAGDRPSRPDRAAEHRGRHEIAAYVALRPSRRQCPARACTRFQGVAADGLEARPGWWVVRGRSAGTGADELGSNTSELNELKMR